jgi:hypothetical protein
VESIKHLLWHGNVDEALKRLGSLVLDLDLMPKPSAAVEKLAAGAAELETTFGTIDNRSRISASGIGNGKRSALRLWNRPSTK